MSRPAARALMEALGVKAKKRELHRAWPVEPPHRIERDGDRLSLLTICVPFPPSLNTYWRHLKNGRTLISEAGRMYKAHIRTLAMLHRLERAFPSDSVAVTLELVMPDHRRRDIDNSAKVIFDAFTSAKVWTDDSQADELHIIRKGVAAPGFVIVTVEAMRKVDGK